MADMRLLFAVGCAAVLADTLTTYLALTDQSSRFEEATTASAFLFSHGLVIGLAVTAAVRIVALSAAVATAARLPALRIPCLFLLVGAAMLTWWTVAANIATMTN